MTGMEGLDRKIVISRFPADSAILAEESKDDLKIKFALALSGLRCA